MFLLFVQLRRFLCLCYKVGVAFQTAAVATACRARGSGVGFSPPAAPLLLWGGPGLPAEGWRQGRDRASLATAGGVSLLPSQSCVWMPVWLRGCRTDPWGWGYRTLHIRGTGCAEGESALGSSPPSVCLCNPNFSPAGIRGHSGRGVCRRAGSGVSFPLRVGGREKKTEKKQQPPAFPFV